MNSTILEQIALNLTSTHIPVTSVVIRFILAGILGTMSSFLYRLYSKEKYIQDFQHALIFLTLIICSSLMIIGNNLASAFGLVGAVSIIRFKTAVKSTRDMSFVLFNIVIGMACGLGFLTLAIISFVLISGSMLLTYGTSAKIDFQQRLAFRIEISYKGDNINQDIIETIFKDNKVKFKLYSISQKDGYMKYHYNITTMDKTVSGEIINGMNRYKGLENIKIKSIID